MLVVFSHISVEDTKIISPYNFLAPLMTFSFHHQVRFFVYLLSCVVIHLTRRSLAKLITKISLLEFPYTPFWYKFLTPIITLQFLHHKQVICAGLHTLHLG